MSVTDNRRIEVSPQKIQAHAELAKGLFSKLTEILNAVEDTVKKTKSVWESESSQLTEDLFFEDKTEFDAAREILRSRISDLENIARIYEDAEASQNAEAEALPDMILN